MLILGLKPMGTTNQTTAALGDYSDTLKTLRVKFPPSSRSNDNSPRDVSGGRVAVAPQPELVLSSHAEIFVPKEPPRWLRDRVEKWCEICEEEENENVY